jgi:hypothetical protein
VKTRYMIVGLADSCPLCIDADGRKGGRTIFQVTAEGGGYSGPCCAAHIAAMIRLSEPEKPAAPKPAQAVPAGNGPPAAQVVK